MTRPGRGPHQRATSHPGRAGTIYANPGNTPTSDDGTSPSQGWPVNQPTRPALPAETPTTAITPAIWADGASHNKPCIY